jgi:NADPH:quinone reductase-like Zn-dependent oxidoreductase
LGNCSKINPLFSNTNIFSPVTMSAPQNQAAWLDAAGTPLRVGGAPMPTAGAGKIVIKNAAVAIDPLDRHMQDVDVFVQQWPAIFGCDVAGEVHEVGPNVERFKKGDRVIKYVGCYVRFKTGL